MRNRGSASHDVGYDPYSEIQRAFTQVLSTLKAIAIPITDTGIRPPPRISSGYTNAR
jgi:hypothetical protein